MNARLVHIGNIEHGLCRQKVNVIDSLQVFAFQFQPTDVLALLQVAFALAAVYRAPV